MRGGFGSRQDGVDGWSSGAHDIAWNDSRILSRLQQIVAPAVAPAKATTADPDSAIIVHHMAVSNDPGYTGGQLWGMYGDLTLPANAFGSQAGEAWANGFTGSTKVAVGIIDTGIDYTHRDLYQNIWLNQGEISATLRSSLTDMDGDALISFRDLNGAPNAGFVTDFNLNGWIDAGDLLVDVRWENGADNDGNGYLDDLIGWDFVNNDNDPYDDNSHGTHVAGTIGATGGNGVGVAGVAWNVLMVPLKFLGANGSGALSAAIAAVDYFTNAAKNAFGVNFVATNNSWGGGSYSAALQSAIDRGAAQDILFVAAAGNGGGDGIGDNNDAVANYPSNYSTLATAGYDAVVAVAALVSNGALASYSNYGVTTVDLGAPGSSIYSTLPGGGYGYKSGTSMATPHVTGAIALYAAANPNATAAQIRAELLSTAAATASLAGKTATGDRLDVAELLGDGGSPPPPPPGLNLVGTAGNDKLVGGALDDALDGLAGNDTLDGGAGADRMTGGLGNDIFYVENSGDIVIELGNGGFDSVRSRLATYTLGDNVERLYLDGTGDLGGTGNALANILLGNSGANILSGLGGNDTLTGYAGADRLEGGDGDDVLTGGGAADTLVGGAGKDRFDFDTAPDIGLGALRDQVLDFVKGQDKLDFAGIDAIAGGANDAFSFIGAGAFAGVAGQLRAAVSGADTVVQGDVNGDGVADFELLLLAYATPLQTVDFVL